MREKPASIAWRIALTYGLVAGLWILVSDRLLATLVGPSPMLTTLSTYKGWAFVAVTAGLLYFVLRRWTQRVVEETTAHQRADARLQKGNRALRMLSDCNQCLIHAPNETELLSRICRSVVETGSYRLAWVGFAENNGAKSVRPVAQYGFAAGYLETVHITWADTERGRGPTGTAIRTGRPCVAQNILTDPRMESWREEARQCGYASSLALPLPGEDRTLGALTIYATEPDAFDPEETKLLAELANDLAFGLRNSRIRAERERSRVALLESEAHYRLLFERNPAPMLIYERGSLQLVAVNEAFERHYGYTRSEALALRLPDLYPPEEKTPITELAHQLHGHAYAGEWHHLKHDGSRIAIVARSHDIVFSNRSCRIAVISDITERQQAEAAMRASELRYQTLAEVSPVGIFQTDAQGLTVYVNPRWCQIAGLSAPDALREGWLRAVHPQDREKLAQDWQEAIQTRRVSIADYRFVHPDGSIVWVMGQAAPEKDESGRIVGYVGTITDVTARREVEAALQESEERLRLLGDNLPDSYVYQYIFAADGTPQFLYLSAGVERLHGVKVADALRDASVLLRQIAPEQLAARAAAEATSLSTMTDFAMEVEIRRADGHRRWLQLRSRPRRGRDDRVLWDGVATDITARKEAEAVLQIREEQLSRVYENVHDVLFVITVTADGDFLFTSVNRQFLEATGLAENQIVGQRVAAIIPASAHSLVLGHYRQAISTRQPVSWEEVSDYPAGQKCGVVTVAPVFDPHGRCTHLIGTVFDITERKRAEEAVRELNATLEQRVRHRTAELEVKNKELETFTYSVSHDLKAPLRGIEGYSRILLEDYAGRLDDDGRRFLNTIRHAALQMGHLIDDLLAYSRLERRARRSQNLQPLALVEALLAERADETQARGVAVRVDVPATSVPADPDGLTLALRNLLDNALKFTGAVPHPAIEVAGRETADALILSVRDNGLGFDMKFHDRIFEIFQRLHRAEDYPGTGIGLAIVRKAMERMGGRVWAESEPGKGATFHLEIPKTARPDG